jgi:hypothetical protein
MWSGISTLNLIQVIVKPITIKLMHAISTKDLAIKLRKEGYPYPYISQQTGLSKSTLSGWLSEVPYTPNQETIEAYGKARAAAGEQKAKLRQLSIESIQQNVAAEIGELSDRDLFMLGLGLYLGEGAKKQGVVVTNADVEVIKLSMAWFYSLGLTREHFRLKIHLYPDSNIEECLQFWSRETTIPMSQFGKTQIDTRTDKRKYNNRKLPYGTAHLVILRLDKKEYGVLLARKIKAWICHAMKEAIKRV